MGTQNAHSIKPQGGKSMMDRMVWLLCPVCGNKIEETNPENEESSQVTTTNSDYSYYNQNNMNATPNNQKADSSSVGFGILSFFFPIVGLILFLVWKGETPRKAKSCGIGALIGVIFNIVVSICYAVIIVSYLETAY